MVDATKLSPRGFHYCNPSTYDGVHYIPRYRTRKSVGPMKYYWVDFGLSIHFPSLEHRQLVYGRVGQERNVPEMSQDAFYDAFKADVFQVGMTMKRLCEVKETFAYFISPYLLLFSRQYYEGLEFLQPFIDRLLQADPEQRPSASEALLKFKQIVNMLKHGKLNGFVIEKLKLKFSAKYPEHYSRLRRKKISAWYGECRYFLPVKTNTTLHRKRRKLAWLSHLIHHKSINSLRTFVMEE